MLTQEEKERVKMLINKLGDDSMNVILYTNGNGYWLAGTDSRNVPTDIYPLSTYDAEIMNKVLPVVKTELSKPITFFTTLFRQWKIDSVLSS